MEADLYEKISEALQSHKASAIFNVPYTLPLKKIILSSFNYISGPELQFVWELECDQYCDSHSSILCMDKDDDYNNHQLNEDYTESTNSHLTSTTESLEDVGTDSRKDHYEEIDNPLEDDLLIGRIVDNLASTSAFHKESPTKCSSMIKSTFSQNEYEDDEINILQQLKESKDYSMESFVDSGLGNTLSIESDLGFIDHTPPAGNLLNELISSGYLVYKEYEEEEMRQLEEQKTAAASTKLKNLSHSQNDTSNTALNVDSDMLDQITADDTSKGRIDDDEFIVKVVLAEQICSLQTSNVPVYNKIISVPSRHIFCSSAMFSMQRHQGQTIMFAITFVVSLDQKGWLLEKHSMIEKFLITTVPKLRASFLVENMIDFLCRLTNEFQLLTCSFCALEKYKFFKRSTFAKLKISESYLSKVDIHAKEVQFLSQCITGCLITKARCVILSDHVDSANEIMLALAPFVDPRNYHLCIKPLSYPFCPYFYLQAVKRNQRMNVLEESIAVPEPLCIIDTEELTVNLTGTYSSKRVWYKHFLTSTLNDIINDRDVVTFNQRNRLYDKLSPVKASAEVLQLLNHIFLLPNERAPRLLLIYQFKLNLELKASAFIDYVRDVSKPKINDKKNAIASRWSLITARKQLSLISDSTFSIILAEADKQIPNFSEFVFTTAKEFTRIFPLVQIKMKGKSKLWFFFLIPSLMSFYIFKLYSNLTSHPKELSINGYTHPDFEKVREEFTNNFVVGWERDGAALTVYHNNKVVVDLWGGYSDVSSGRKWKEDTMNIAFSSSKALGAICIALLVDQGHLNYEDKIVKYWPEFGKNMKENITIQMVMTHTSGVVLIDKQIEIEDALAPDVMKEIIENQKPYWEPGTQIGYHAISYGWLVDQIIRHVDPKKRTIGKFFKEEITDIHGIDVYLGLPKELSHRVSRLSGATILDRIDEFITNPQTVDYWHCFKDAIFDRYLTKMSRNPSWMQSVFKMTLNNPDVYEVQQCAALGIGTARGFAKLFNKVINGEVISLDLVKRISIPYTGKDLDIVTGARIQRGYGFTYIPIEIKGEEKFLVGHAGLGGQNVRYNIDENVSYSYLSNGMKSGLGDTARTYLPLRDAIFESILKLKERR
uniref:Beta-lactamase domain-containing protein n=1 Tax=Parastrongyloides trichosuri TaxID=131310 RepID=A0A0N5A4A1_PARTI